MPKLKNDIGQKYNQLTVLGVSGRNKHNQIVLKCKCDCGKIKDVVHFAVRGGRTKSCGCQQFVRKLKDGEAAFNKVVDNMKRSAKVRSHAWELSIPEIKELFNNNCFYCGLPPSNIGKPPTCCKGNYVYSGIDRMDSDKGYFIANCVSCCIHCNIAKQKRTMSEFFDWIKRINTHHAQLVPPIGM